MLARALPLGLLVILVGGCATVPTSPLSTRIVTVPSRSLVFRGIRAETQGDAIIVRGRVGRRSMMPGAVWGHLHVEMLSGGAVEAWADTRWSQLAKRRLPTSYFYVRLPATARPIDEIRVSHVQQGHGGARQSGNPK